VSWKPEHYMHIINESPLNECILHASVRFARLFRCQLRGEGHGETRAGPITIWSVDVCRVPRLGRFVLFSEEHSLFTFIISSGYRRSLTPVLESFHTRGEELSRELGLSERASFSLTTWHFGKRVNRHIIGSQNDFIYLFGCHLEDTAPPVKEDVLQKIEDSLNQTPMSYLDMESPRAALFRFYEKT
jgi:hypothetical protein